MKSSLFFVLGLAAFFSSFSPLIKADDWKTTDGKVYHNVTVIKAEPDAVTITHQDGGALVPLAKLPPDLQKRFNYDPVKAKAAADARVQNEAKNAVALQAEMIKARDQKQAELIATDPRTPHLMAANAALPSYRGSPSYTATTTFDPMGQPTTTIDSTPYTPNTEITSNSEDKMSDPPAAPDLASGQTSDDQGADSAPTEPAAESTASTSQSSAIVHHSASDLVDIHSRLKDDHPSPNRHTMASFLLASSYLMPDPLDTNHHSTDELLNSASPLALPPPTVDSTRHSESSAIDPSNPLARP